MINTGSISQASQEQYGVKKNYEKRVSKKEKEKQVKQAKDDKDFYGSLIDKINADKNKGEVTTLTNSNLDATSNANAEQLQSFSAGMNKSQAASLGNSILGSQAINSYDENIDTNNANAREELMAYVENILKAKGKTKDLENLQEIASIENQQDWINSLLNIAEVGYEGANSIIGGSK